MLSIPAVLFTIVLRFYANSPADLAIISTAQPVATDLLARAGITPTWIICKADEPCDAPVDGDVLVRLALNPPNGSRRCGNAAGTGLAPSGMVTLYTRCIESGAESLRVALPIVAGYSLVHEIGHLMLRRRGHAMSGLMAAEPDWRYAASRGLGFAPGEVARIHEMLSRSAAEREKRTLAAADTDRKDKDSRTPSSSVAR